MYPETDGIMRHSRVEQAFHPLFHMLRHVLEPYVVNPMLRCIFDQRKIRQIVSGDILVQVYQDAQTGLCHESMSRCHSNVIAAGYNVTRCSKAGGRQKFFNRKVRELYNLRPFNVDYRKQTRACTQYGVYWVVRAQIFIKFRNWSCIKIECEELSKFIDAERAESHCDALE